MDLGLWKLKISYKFAVQTALQKPGQGNAGGSAEIMESVYCALSWLVETWKTSITVKDVANSRCLVDMHILSTANA